MTASLLKLARAGKQAIATYLSAEYPRLSQVQQQQIGQILILQLVTLWLCQQQSLPALDYGYILQDDRSNPDADQSRDQSFADRLAEQWRLKQLPCACPAMKEIHLPDQVLRSIFAGFERLSGSGSTPSIILLGQVYESLLEDSLPQPQIHAAVVSPVRKTSGIYYTPIAIVRYIVKTLLEPLFASSGNDRIGHPAFPAAFTLVDPACGSGAFLIAAYQLLLDQYLQRYLSNPQQATERLTVSSTGAWQLTQAERSRILLTHLYGVDLDPQAIEVTRLGLLLQLTAELAEVTEPWPDLSQNFRCGNAIIEEPDPQGQSAFNWVQAFPLVFQLGGFDVVVGNPPYLDSEWMTLHLPDWRRYCTAHYQTASGNWDLFCVFIEKAWQICKPGGLTSLVVPNKLASAHYAAKARSLLTPHLRTIRNYSRVAAFRASVYPLVYIAQKEKPASGENGAADSRTHIWYEEMETIDRVGQSRWLTWTRNPGLEHPWQFVSSKQAGWIDRLHQTYPTLEKVATVTGAATVAEAYRLKPWIRDRAANQATEAATDWRLVNSGTIDRYTLLWGKKPMRYLGQSYLHPVIGSMHLSQLPLKRQQQAQQPKIIVAGMTQVLECALDQTGSILAGKSTTVIQAIATPLDLRYLLGLLNSRLLSLYLRTRFSGNQLQGGYLRIGTPQLRQLPIWIPDLSRLADRQNYEQLIDWVDNRLRLAQLNTGSEQASNQADCDRLDHAIDHLVYRLYQLEETEIEELLSDTISDDTKV